MYEQNHQDVELTCSDCNQTFVFTSEEQEFYAQKGFSSPKRCSFCRANRKNQRGGGSQKQFYEVKCDQCGCDTTVPFKPREDKPVYCSECFKASRT
jgi:CxxC-x17-CxxC domain-containing protein